MRQLKEKKCIECGEDYLPTGSCSKVCSLCKPTYRRKKAAEDQQKYRVKHGLIEKPGVGKGGNVKRGQEHHSYKNGIGYFQDNRKRIKEERRYCEECSKDLQDAGRYEWCLHHIDHNRTNNDDSNFKLLCKRCHQIEHDCHLAFGTCND